MVVISTGDLVKLTGHSVVENRFTSEGKEQFLDPISQNKPSAYFCSAELAKKGLSVLQFLIFLYPIKSRWQKILTIALQTFGRLLHSWGWGRQSRRSRIQAISAPRPISQSSWLPSHPIQKALCLPPQTGSRSPDGGNSIRQLHLQVTWWEQRRAPDEDKIWSVRQGKQ